MSESHTLSLSSEGRPRLLYINGPWDHLSARLRAAYVDPVQQLLGVDFAVVSVATPCDLGKQIDLHRPDLIVFHSGIECPEEPVMQVNNTGAGREIPRAIYVSRDPFTPSRAIALERAAKWQVDAIFANFHTSDALAPAFDDAYYIPWWLDDQIYKDYGEIKTIPVSLTGAGWFNRQLYHWRSGVAEALSRRLPFFHTPSLGSRDTGFEFYGEHYARLLNRSFFSAGCGSVNRYLTQKLLEIPGSATCLVTEETEILRRIGFRDGVNCVFATPDNVADKLEILLKDRSRLAAMTIAGYTLVHNAHTLRHRRQFIEWYRLWGQKGPNQRIVQGDPWGPLRLAEKDEVLEPVFVRENPYLDRLKRGFALLEENNPTEAIRLFQAASNEIAWSAEPRLGLGLSLARIGKDADAARILAGNLSQTLYMGGNNPDPVDLAVLGMILLNGNTQKMAVGLLHTGTQRRHPALNAARWICHELHGDLTKGMKEFRVEWGDNTLNRVSLQKLPPNNFEEWAYYLIGLLREPMRGDLLKVVAKMAMNKVAGLESVAA